MNEAGDWGKDPLETFQIDLALAVLSLDLTVGTLVPMGLAVPDEEAFRATLREGRRAPAPEGAMAGAAARLSLTFARLEARFGEPFVAYFLVWLRNVFLHPPGDAQVFYWWQVLLRGTYDGAVDVKAPPSLGVRLRIEIERGDQPVVPEIPEAPWDHEVLRELQARHPRDARRPLPSPLAIVANRIRYVAFLRAWQKAIARSTSPSDDIDALWSWGKREAELMKMAPHLLERPDQWPKLPEPPAALIGITCP